MSYNPDLAIDLDKIVASRAKGKKIPRRLINILKKVIHQDFINGYLTQGYEGVEFCRNCINYLNVKLDVEGLGNIDFSGGTRYTFVSNHPLGGIDGVALGAIIGEPFGGNIKYLVNDLLMNVKGLAPLCVPVNVIGGQSRDLPRLIDEAFASDKQMLMFPGKLCSRKIDGKIQDLPWGKAFVNKSVRFDRKIVPIHFIGQNSKRFYNIANLCKILKLKFNFAMLLLPDELYKAQGKSYRVVIGEPIDPQALDDSHTATEWAQWIRSKVYELK